LQSLKAVSSYRNVEMAGIFALERHEFFEPQQSMPVGPHRNTERVMFVRSNAMRSRNEKQQITPER
jgi:hypothetical protein